MRLRAIWLVALLVLLPGLVQAQSSDYIRYYPAPVAGTSGGGATFTAPVLLPNGTATAPSLAFTSSTGVTGFYFRPDPFYLACGTSNQIMWCWNNSAMIFRSSMSVGWSSSTPGDAAMDTILVRDAAATLALRNAGTAGTPVPQAFNVYNFCDGAACATGYERLAITGSATDFTIGVEKAGTGTSRAIQIGSSTSTTAISLNSASSVVTWNSLSRFFPSSNDVGDIGASTNSWQNGYFTRSIQGSKSKTLTDAGAAVAIWRVAVPTNGYAGGDVIFTANSTDGTNRLTTTGRVTFAGADTAGTVTCGIGTPYALATAYRRANTLLCTFTAVTSTTNCDISVTCTDNLAAAQTMAIESRLDMPTPNTITPQ